MINRVVLTGRLTQDVALRYTQGGTAVGNFNLAVDRRFKNQQGEREADFVRCIIWRKGAETFANYFHKGSLVGIEGHIQTRNYENQQGVRVYVTEVVIENFSFLESKKTNTQSGQKPSEPTQPDNQGTPSATNDDPIDISDDGMPF